MKNSQIKYKTSTNYDRLYDLLKDGQVVVGFIAVSRKGLSAANNEYSKLVAMSYDAKSKFFDLGFIFFESDFDKMSFNELCEIEMLRYIDLN